MKNKSKKANFSPNGEKFAKFLKEAYGDNLEYDETKARPVDYSFINVMPEQTQERVAARRRSNMWKTMSRAAAGVLIFSTAVLGTAIWLNSDQATAGNFAFKRVFYEIRNGLFTSDSGESQKDYTEEDVNIFKIDTMEDIDKAKKFMPNLCEPHYIPDGYLFESLEVLKRMEGICVANYKYKFGDDFLYINMQDSMEEKAISDSLMLGNKLEGEDLLACTWEDVATDTHGVNIAKGDSIIFITGDVSMEEMVSIAKNLK